jgi:hypothetical protein
VAKDGVVEPRGRWSGAGQQRWCVDGVEPDAWPRVEAAMNAWASTRV